MTGVQTCALPILDLGKAGKAGAIPHAIRLQVVVDGLVLSWTQPLSMRSGIRRRCGERDKQNGSCKRKERCGTNESHDDLLGSRSRFIRTSARIDRRVPEVIPWIAMSNYFEALVFGHAFAPDIFSYRSIGFADVGVIVIISRACLYMSKSYLAFRSAGKGSMAGRRARGLLLIEHASA